MRNPISPTAALLAAALAVTICTGSALAASRPVTAATFVLKRSDVPASFNAKTDYTRPISLTDALARYSLKAAILSRQGWMGGYDSVFNRQYQGKRTAHGFYGVADSVTQFKSTSGAHWFFQRMKHGASLKSSASIPTIGNEVAALDSGSTNGTHGAEIAFRHGDFVVSVSTSYIGTGDPLPKAIHYARLINHRLTAHSR